ncbi:MAG: hypothetical protein QXO21_05575 [Candidatus Anstonellales archaeon]
MRKLGMKALIGLGVVVVSTATLVSSCGGSNSSSGMGSSSSSTSSATNSNNEIPNTPSKLEKNAYLTISIPALAQRIQSQLLPEDVTKVVVTIYQYPQTSSDGVICEEYQSCNITEEKVTLTPQNPTATVTLFPGFTKVCISTVSYNTYSTNVMCGIAILKTGNNTLNYTLVRGTWSLPEDKDIAGFKKFAIKGMSQNYESAYYYNPSLNMIASSDGNTWYNIDGGYVQGDYDKGGKGFGFGKKDNTGNQHGFVALDGNPNGVKVLNIGYLYSPYGYVLKESESSFKIEDRNGQDVTNTLFESCKFESTDGKSIKGCIIKNAKKSTQQDYTYKLTHTSKRTGANICYDHRDRYDSASDVCYNNIYYYDYNYDPNTGTYTTQYRCYDSTYTFNTDKQRCEASLKDICEKYGGSYDSATKSCTETETEYYTVGSVERVTITGSGSLPSSGSIIVQKK